ncbi:UDP-3-O-[3-hydroxymyristoyl] glucosamine N-acyltransferase [Hyphomonas hirschiana VP5]|uniref:UDP-3-O-acylglucosamine N-acyltransferase n=1 Tax=Hyphomonas hirschiana VP5 TaxID=1280951 RepID=A0A059FWN7_9PROT|nr:UDP-3-O-[3-hydroxymyristoyl] glucosamine N-acyltransferase [Hyphomonas hirschiana VP5]
MTLEEIAGRTGSNLAGKPNQVISGIASAANAKAAEIAFIEGDGKRQPTISPSLAAVFVAAEMKHFIPEGVGVLETAFPRNAHSAIASSLFRPRHLMGAGHELVSALAQIHANAIVQPGAVIGPGAAVGEGAVIGANAVIGPGVQIGRNTSIGANASIHCALVGDQVTILAGARIGETGFGVLVGPQGAEDSPHFGRVIIQDHVTIGANSCIDRGVFEDTIIGERTKIDNLCQIAHNVVLGRGVIVAAFGGISGSVRVGDGSMLGGRVGIADHVKVGDRVSLAASAGLFRDVDSGETWGGTPAKPIRQWMREVAWLQKQANPKKSN